MNRTKTLLILVILLLGLMPLFADHTICVIVTGGQTLPGRHECDLVGHIDRNTLGYDHDPFINGCHFLDVPDIHDPGIGAQAYATVIIGDYSWSGSAPYDISGSFIHINVGGMPDTGKTPGTP